jgi:hypothetical protein
MRRFSRLSGPVAAWTGLDRLRDTTTTNGNRLCAVQSSLEADSEKTKTGPGPVASKIVKKPDWTGLSNTNVGAEWMDMQRGRQQNEDSEQSRNTCQDHQHGGMIQLVDLALVNAFAPCVHRHLYMLGLVM